MIRYATLSLLIPALTAASTAGPTPPSTQDNTAMQMRRAKLADVELEYEERGAGEPVILVHAGVFADWFAPLMEEPALNSRYRLVRYHRVGYAGSSRVTGPVSISDHARHLRAFMRHLGIVPAHIVHEDVQRDVFRNQVRTLAQAGLRRRVHAMARRTQRLGHPIPAPAAVPGAV